MPPCLHDDMEPQSIGQSTLSDKYNTDFVFFSHDTVSGVYYPKSIVLERKKKV
jgi:hypothetical protein